MPNNNFKKTKAAIKSLDSKALILLKLLILFVILLLPLACIFFDISHTISNYKQLKTGRASLQNLNEQKKVGSEFNFEAPLPAEQMGSLSNVSKEKIDSLFDNLKK